MTTALEKRIKEIEESVGGYADISALTSDIDAEDGKHKSYYISRNPGITNFFRKHFSGELFWKVQVSSGVVSNVLRVAAAYYAFELTGEANWTIPAGQIVGGGSYAGSYFCLFSLINKEKYGSYNKAMKAAAGYWMAEAWPNVISFFWSSGAHFGMMQAGVDPVSSSFFGPFVTSKLINLPLGTLPTNFLYKHGGSNVVKGIYHSIKGTIGHATSYTNNVTEIIGQYLTIPFKH